jgi:purine-binding chemotaxis protein CheW
VTIDWPEAHARLDRWQRALAGVGERSPEEVARILADRAAALALPPPEAAPASPAGSLDLLVLALAEERYAVEAAQVVEVVVPRELTPLPLVPDFLLGAVYHQGRMVPVFDLRRLMGLAGQAWTAGTPVVVVETEGIVFGLRADAVTGTRRLGAQELGPLPAGAAPDRGAWFRGLSADMILVVDLPALAGDPRLAINDDGARARGG